jgi:hypothetical protein
MAALAFVIPTRDPALDAGAPKEKAFRGTGRAAEQSAAFLFCPSKH